MRNGIASVRNLYKHFAHWSLIEPRKCCFYVAEREYAIDHRALAESIEARDNLIPSGHGVLRRIVGDGDASYAIAAEEECRSVELRHDATTPADNTDAPAIAEHRDDLIEERAGNVVYDDVYSFRRYR